MKTAADNTGWHGGSVDGLVIKISLGGVEKSALVQARYYPKEKEGYENHLVIWEGNPDIHMYFRYTPSNNTVEILDWPTVGFDTQLDLRGRQIQILSIGGTEVNCVPFPSPRYSR